MRYYFSLIFIVCSLISGCGSEPQLASFQEEGNSAARLTKEDAQEVIPYDLNVNIEDGITLHRGSLKGSFWGLDIDGPANYLRGSMTNEQLIIKVIREDTSYANMALLIFNDLTDILTPGNEFYQDTTMKGNGCTGPDAYRWPTDTPSKTYFFKTVEGPDNSVRVMFELNFNRANDYLAGSFDFSRAESDDSN